MTERLSKAENGRKCTHVWASFMVFLLSYNLSSPFVCAFISVLQSAHLSTLCGVRSVMMISYVTLSEILVTNWAAQ